MDGYLAKPVDPKALFAAIESVDYDQGAAPDQPTAATAFDLAGLEARTGGDRALLGEVIRLFLEDCPLRMAAIREAIATGDGSQIRAAAHGLKGAAGYVSGSKVVEAASELERLGAENPVVEASTVQDKLVAAVGELVAALRDYEDRAPRVADNAV